MRHGYSKYKQLCEEKHHGNVSDHENLRLWLGKKRERAFLDVTAAGKTKGGNTDTPLCSGHVLLDGSNLKTELSLPSSL